MRTGVYGVPAALGAALACFLIRLAGIRYNINAPIAPEAKREKTTSEHTGIPVRRSTKIEASWPPSAGKPRLPTR